MRQQLTAEVAAPRADVWAALARDLAQRGAHVDVLEERAPESLHLLVRTSAGERLTLSYRLDAIDTGNTAVVATIDPSGPFYLVKKLLSLGSAERGYMDLLAAGLGNLQRHFVGDGGDETAAAPGE